MTTKNMRRIRKGDIFIDGEKYVEVMGWPEDLGDGRVKVPVWVNSSARPSRRIYDAAKRVKLFATV